MLTKDDFGPPDTVGGNGELAALGIVASPALLSSLQIQRQTDRLESVLALAAGERQRLGELLCAAECVTPEQINAALAEQRSTDRKLGEILIEMSELTPRERDVALEFQRRQARATPATGNLCLGNILVATGQITRAQLEEALHRQAVSGRRLGEELVDSGQATKGQVEGGLLLQRKLLRYALVLAMALAPLAQAPSAQAGQSSANLAVSAVVMPRARVEIDYQVSQLQVTEADLERGYVDVPAASRFLVSTNSRSGYAMDFFPVGYVFESVQIRGLDGAAQIGADGGTIVLRDATPSRAAYELGYRFMLRPEVRPGIYQWPLLLSVRPL